MRRFAFLAPLALLIALLGFPLPAAGSLGNPRTAYLTSNVTIAATGLTNGPSETLNAGTWIVSGALSVQWDPICELWDGTTVIASGQASQNTGLTLSGYIVETGPAVLRWTCSGGGEGGILYASVGFGNTASYVTAYRAP